MKTEEFVSLPCKSMCVNIYDNAQVLNLKELFMLPCLFKHVVYPEVQVASL